MAFNGARTSTGIFALWFSTSMGSTITGTDKQWCRYRYWHFCTLVQYQYGHIPLLVMAFNCVCTGTGIVAFCFSTSMGMDHYQNWYSVVSVLVLAFGNFGSVSVWAYSITGTGIKWCQYPYWHLWILVQYQYQHGTLPALALNGARTGIGIFALLSNTSMGTVNYRYWQ